MKTEEFLTILGYLNKNWEKPWEVEAEMSSLLKKSRMSRLVELGRTSLPTDYGPMTYLVFGDYATGKEHDVAILGKFEGKKLRSYKYPLVRIHSACRSSELFHASNCECRQELDFAIRQMSKEKKGILIYLNQEGAGNGIKAKLIAYNNTFEWKDNKVIVRKDKKTGKDTNVYYEYAKAGYQNEHRDFEIAASILKILGVSSVRLMTNNPNKIQGLVFNGIKVKPFGIHIKPENKMMKEHLITKAEKLGHKITSEDLK
ncbi:MAG: hypothetical protein ACP5RE_00215 [Candidatus Acidifodinimicrobium sp.]